MSNIKNIALVTYTNSKCHDVLSIHLSQIDKFANNFKSYVFTNDVNDKFLKNFSNHTFLEYDNNKPYYKQYLSCLSKVNEDYIIYLQEDFFLYDYVNETEIIRCLKFLKDTEYSFVRLIKTMLQGAIHRKELKMKEFPDVLLTKNIYDAYIQDPNSFAFHMQSTLWEKETLKNLYLNVKSNKWFESREWDRGMRELNIKGAFYHDYAADIKLGKYHWESLIFPHICTAVGKGKWSISHHTYKDNILLNILKEYNVDIDKRGVR